MKDFHWAIEQMSSIEWFSRTGIVEDCGVDVELNHVANWKEALDLVGQDHVADAFNEASNMLTRELSQRFRSDYRLWNKIAGDVRDELESYIFPALDAILENNKEVQSIEGGVNLAKMSVRWDLSHFAMEYSYSDLVPMRFFEKAFQIYRCGHFPCNWNREWPDGVIWVW